MCSNLNWSHVFQSELFEFRKLSSLITAEDSHPELLSALDTERWNWYWSSNLAASKKTNKLLKYLKIPLLWLCVSVQLLRWLFLSTQVLNQPGKRNKKPELLLSSSTRVDFLNFWFPYWSRARWGRSRTGWPRYSRYQGLKRDAMSPCQRGRAEPESHRTKPPPLRPGGDFYRSKVRNHPTSHELQVRPDSELKEEQTRPATT